MSDMSAKMCAEFKKNEVADASDPRPPLGVGPVLWSPSIYGPV